MNYLYVVLLSVLSLVVLFLLSKLMGNKQLSQMTAFDYIIGITIGSIAAELATGTHINPLENVVALVVYGVSATGIAVITSKSLWLRKVITGRPLVLMDKGELYRANMKKARIDISDFLTMCRELGYFDITQIQTAVIEHNGKLSILPVSTARNMTPQDMNLAPEQENVMTSVILDGHVMENNLKIVGYNKKWLETKLSEQKLRADDVFLAYCDNEGKLTTFKINNNRIKIDWFE